VTYKFLSSSSLFMILALGAVTSARAEPITVTFTAFPAAGDPVNTSSSTGSFTFDSSLIPAGGGLIQDSSFGLGVTDVNFRWSNTLWSRANADVGELQFSSSGALLAWVLGSTLSPTGRGGIYSYVTSPASAVVNDIFVSTFAGIGGASRIVYTNAGFEGALIGRLLTDSVPAPVPEPSTIFLLGTGAALLARRRSARFRAQP
jgi:hypothetical protein